MKRRIIISVLFILFIVHGFAQKQFILKGTIAGINDKTIYLYKDTGDQLIKMDSTVTEGGMFLFTGNCTQPFVAQLRIAKDKRCRFFISPAKMELRIDADRVAYGFLLNELKGSPAQNRFVAFQQQIAENLKQQQKLLYEMELPEVKGNPANKKVLVEKLNRLKKFKHDYFYRYATSPVVAYLIYQEYFVRKRSLDFLKEKLKFLAQANPQGMYVKNMQKRVRILTAFKENGIFPHMETYTVDGSYFSLEQLRGKKVLMYVWRAWDDKNNQKYYDAVQAVHRQFPNLAIVNIIRNSSFNVVVDKETKQKKPRKIKVPVFPGCFNIESVDKKLEITQYLDNNVNGFLLDESGNILFHKNDFSTAELLKEISEFQKQKLILKPKFKD